MQESRVEYNRTINQLGGKGNELMQSATARISQEIDTDEEWEPAGNVPDEAIKIRCHISQDEIDKAMRTRGIIRISKADYHQQRQRRWGGTLSKKSERRNKEEYDIREEKSPELEATVEESSET